VFSGKTRAAQTTAVEDVSWVCRLCGATRRAGVAEEQSGLSSDGLARTSDSRQGAAHDRDALAARGFLVWASGSSWGRTSSSELGWDYPSLKSVNTKFVGQAGANLSFASRTEAPLLQGTLRNRRYDAKRWAPTSEPADERREMPLGHAPGGHLVTQMVDSDRKRLLTKSPSASRERHRKPAPRRGPC
jgi:hypothetical protein